MIKNFALWFNQLDTVRKVIVSALAFMLMVAGPASLLGLYVKLPFGAIISFIWGFLMGKIFVKLTCSNG